MPSAKQLFHYISYLQYPLILVAVYHSIKPYFTGFENVWADLNGFLIFAGLSISFSTLQDTQKTQNKVSRKVWENPTAGKTFLVVLSLMTLLTLIFGVFGFFTSENEIITEPSVGVIVLGIGLVGLLKAAIEMFENHRKDKQRNQMNE